MSDYKRIWRLVLPIALFALLLCSTAGVVWHHHQTQSAADTCPICHLSHQAIEPAAANVQVTAPVPTEAGPEAQPIHLPPVSAPRDIPARGPPAHA